MKKTMWRDLTKGVLFLLLIAVVTLMFIAAVRNIEKGTADNAAEQLENSVRRAAVTCYACEGVYPPSLEYLEDNYGLQINADRYTVKYEVFADNIMPDITVLERNR